MSYDALFEKPTIERMKASPNSKWNRDPTDVISMWLASPDFPIVPEIKKAVIKAVEAEDMYYSSDINTREAMAEKLKRVNHLDADPNNIMLCQGVDPAIWLGVKYACNPGEEVIVPNPMYGPFLSSIAAMETKPVYWDIFFDEGYKFDPERLKELITKKTKLITVCNPHNPSSRIMTKKELEAIADIAVDHNIHVFVDELWEDIRFDDKPHVSLASLNPEISDITMTAWGFSKTYGIAGLYLGYMYTSNNEILREYKKRARLIQRGATNLAQAAAPVLCFYRNNPQWLFFPGLLL